MLGNIKQSPRRFLEVDDISLMLIHCYPQAYELSVLTGTQVLLLVVSETGLVYTFTTPKLQPLVTKPEGKNLIQVCCLLSPSCYTLVLTRRSLGVSQCARARSREREWR